MLTALVAHTGRPPAPHDLWRAWNLDLLVITGLATAAWAYRRGRAGRSLREDGTRRARCFAGALAALAVALISPLDALSSALASAHMVQHVLIVLVAAPLLALSAPSATLLHGSPLVVRRTLPRWRRKLRLSHADLRPLRDPVTVWLLHVAALWFWHASGPYDAALGSEPLHILEHTTFLVTALLFWQVAIGARSAGRVTNGYGALLVFAMALQSTFLSALLTFARTPWYSGYATTTRPWHLDPLADQQLAGVIMWVPAGLVYFGAALALFVTWLRATELEARPRDAGPARSRGAPARRGSAGPA